LFMMVKKWVSRHSVVFQECPKDLELPTLQHVTRQCLRIGNLFVLTIYQW
jgi:hypothetical protein